ncbi:MAG: carboxypeptidase regulatory-like domain-containing protein [Candidatus Eisenbacteria bacterium]|nr:carboxypeptidase regulatory-like domain-containing protein [Candidatus Eisenbacteria bacterium]
MLGTIEHPRNAGVGERTGRHGGPSALAGIAQILLVCAVAVFGGCSNDDLFFVPSDPDVPILLVHGKVIDAASGIPLSDASVIVEDGDPEFIAAHTDDQGRFSTPYITRETTQVRIQRAGYLAVRGRLGQLGDQIAGHQWRLDAPLRPDPSTPPTYWFDSGQTWIEEGPWGTFVAVHRASTEKSATVPLRWFFGSADSGDLFAEPLNPNWEETDLYFPSRIAIAWVHIVAVQDRRQEGLEQAVLWLDLPSGEQRGAEDPRAIVVEVADREVPGAPRDLAIPLGVGTQWGMLHGVVTGGVEGSSTGVMPPFNLEVTSKRSWRDVEYSEIHQDRGAWYLLRKEGSRIFGVPGAEIENPSPVLPYQLADFNADAGASWRQGPMALPEHHGHLLTEHVTVTMLPPERIGTPQGFVEYARPVSVEHETRDAQGTKVATLSEIWTFSDYRGLIQLERELITDCRPCHLPYKADLFRQLTHVAVP